MIKNNFNELVAQRKLKITRISNDTGISRPTLNSLTRDDGKGIQYDTLNRLCNYFNITPSDFFDYIPYEFTINLVDTDKDTEIEYIDGIRDINYKEYELFINVYNNKWVKMDTYSLNCVFAIQTIPLDPVWNEEKEEVEDGVQGNAIFTIKNQTSDDVSFLDFLRDNFSIQWGYNILEFIEKTIASYGHEKFDNFDVQNELKELI